MLCAVRVAVHTNGLTAEQLDQAFLLATDDIGATVRDEMRKCGPGATCCALPAGPETIPFVSGA